LRKAVDLSARQDRGAERVDQQRASNLCYRRRLVSGNDCQRQASPGQLVNGNPCIIPQPSVKSNDARKTPSTANAVPADEACCPCPSST